MRKSIILFALILLTLTQIVTAQKSWDEIEYPPLNTFEKPDIDIFELENGITFYLVEDDELPLINLRVLVRTGGVLVPGNKTGLNSIAGTVMRTGGTTSIPGDDVNELLEDRAARMEASIGLSSGSAGMNVLKDDFEELLPVFIDLLQNPAFPDNRIQLAKTQQKTSISRRNDESIPIGLREFQKLLYGSQSVYAKSTEYETIDNITREDLVQFHQKSFVGRNMMIGVIGDFSSSEMKEVLRDTFSEIPAGEPLSLDFPEVDYEFVNSINFVDKRDVNQSFVMMGHIGGMRDNPDYAALQVMNRVLSDGSSGRLMRIVRSQMGLAYAVFGEYGSGNFFPGMFYAGVMTQSETTAEAINAILEQIRRLQDEAVSERELSDTIDRFLNSLVFQYDSRASVLNERMSLDYAGLDPETFDRLVEEIQQVTIDDIQRVAQQYLKPDALQILVVGNGAEIGDQLEQFGEVNMIDITIPVPGEAEEETVAGDAAAGAEWLSRMASALLPDGPIEGELIFEADNTVQGPMGEMVLGVRQTVNFDDDKLIAEVTAPMGVITMQIMDGEGVMMMGGNQMPMPPAQKEEMLSEHKRNPLYIAMHSGTFTSEYHGMTETEDGHFAHIVLVGDTRINLYLDPETAAPASIAFRQFDPEQGQQVTMKRVFAEWTLNDGVMLPYQTDVYQGDDKISSITVKTHSVDR